MLTAYNKQVVLSAAVPGQVVLRAFSAASSWQGGTHSTDEKTEAHPTRKRRS